MVTGDEKLGKERGLMSKFVTKDLFEITPEIARLGRIVRGK